MRQKKTKTKTKQKPRDLELSNCSSPGSGKSLAKYLSLRAGPTTECSGYISD